MPKYTYFLLLGFCFWVYNSRHVPLLLRTPHLWQWGINTVCLWGVELGALSLPCSQSFLWECSSYMHREGETSCSIKSFCLASGEFCIYIYMCIYTLYTYCNVGVRENPNLIFCRLYLKESKHYYLICIFLLIHMDLMMEALKLLHTICHWDVVAFRHGTGS